MLIYNSLLQAKRVGEKKFGILIDPDKQSPDDLNPVVEQSVIAGVDFLLVGGSLILQDQMESCIEKIRNLCNLHIILFPGDHYQICRQADGILLLSLISGRNADLLIGRHVIAAPYLKESSLEVISTGYMLIECGVSTSVSYMSNTQPIPSNKTDIAVCTALAGEMLGLKLLYLDTGSGAIQTVPRPMIEAVAMETKVPIIVGGGIDNPYKAQSIVAAGADIVVVGNALEKNPKLIAEIADAIHSFSTIQ
jgi:phosphoglycerol geranylgeranyltransferase